MASGSVIRALVDVQVPRVDIGRFSTSAPSRSSARDRHFFARSDTEPGPALAQNL